MNAERRAPTPGRSAHALDLARTVVAEVLSVNEPLRELLYRRSSNEQLLQAARQGGFRSMQENALWLVVRGEVMPGIRQVPCCSKNAPGCRVRNVAAPLVGHVGL